VSGERVEWTVAGTSSTRPTARWILAALVCAGFTLRIWSLPTVGLDHYDEGVYALSGLGLVEPGHSLRLYPNQERFSPPAYLGVVGLSYLLAGSTSDRAAVLTNVVLGTCTIPAIFLVGRRWFGSAAGLIAATLLTFNELHILLSRSVLTDTAFALFLLIAVALLAEAFARGSATWAIAGGLMTGLAWNTKYHGWFALVIAAAAIASNAWACREWRTPRARWIAAIWLIAAVIAAVSYVPWAMFVELRLGGYAALARYESTLLSHHWFDNLAHQIRMLHFLDGTWTRMSIFAAAAIGAAVQPLRQSTRTIGWAGILAAGAAILGGGTPVIIILAAFVVPVLLRESRSFGAATTLAWLALWLVSTPMYRPYFRLVLPGLIAAFLAVGAYWSAQTAPGQDRSTPGRPQWLILAVLSVVVAIASARIGSWGDVWRPRRDVAEAVAAMNHIIPQGTAVVVVGEPAAAFYFQVAGRPAFEQPPLGSLRDSSGPSYLVAGRYARVAPTIRQELERLGDRLQMVQRYSIDPGDLRLLDDYAPEAAVRFRAHPDADFALTLYRITPLARPD
jgi:dolichyl-phosphate-mannose-protein mannosyltransferase